MKSHIQNLAMMSAVIAFASCNSAKTDAKPEIQTEATAAGPEDIQTETRSVEGIVHEILNGKDGYTATIETADKEIYLVTISHSNLKDHTQFKGVKVGETLKVSGDFWKMENTNNITAREIHE